MTSAVRIPLVITILSLAACGPGHEHVPDAGGVDPERPEDAIGSAAVVDDDWVALLPNARQPRESVVSGGQPSEDQLRMAAEAGYKTVINLRTPGESGLEDEAAIVGELGMTYVSLPIDGEAGITADNARELSRLLDESEAPVLLHCGSGNRVGALLALEAFHVEGRSAEESIQYGLDSGLTRLEPVVRERLASPRGD